MYSEADLIRKFESIERLFVGAKTAGEKQAAANALTRIKQRLDEIEKIDPPIEYRFSLSDMWSRRLFSALLRRYDIEPYRYYRQRRTTVMAKVPKQFVDTILWPEFEELNKMLKSHLNEITSSLISKAIFKDDSEATVKDEAPAISNAPKQ
ncbi:MAG: hypothetical protein Q9M31_04230 [Mariprofundus sp.]|nr:hypothetical protein [Mariprofundus sp.]